jgi:hypothetical protein
VSDQERIGLDLVEVRKLMAALEGLAPAARRAVGRLVRPMGQDVLREATANAAAFSRRIPGSLSLQIRLAGARPGIVIRASLAVAPHARAFEGLVEDVWKHPLFGDRDWWFAQQARPYMQPAVLAAIPRAQAELTAAINEIHRRAGLA